MLPEKDQMEITKKAQILHNPKNNLTLNQKLCRKLKCRRLKILSEAHEVPVPRQWWWMAWCAIFLLCQDLDDSQHLKTTSDLAWRFEVDVPADDVCFNISHDQVEELIFLASNPKKQRTEVKLSTLSPSEKAEFEKAKQTEVDNWLKTGTVCKILRNKLSAEQILRCRWIYVRKPIEDKDEQKRIGKDKKAKARLVVLGFLDPCPLTKCNETVLHLDDNPECWFYSWLPQWTGNCHHLTSKPPFCKARRRRDECWPSNQFPKWQKPCSSNPPKCVNSPSQHMD